MNGDHSRDDESLDDLGRELRERVGHDMRQEAEMVEQDAATFELRRRRLADVAIDLLSRGDTVTVIAGDRSIRGHLSHARGDIASVQTSAGRFDVHLAAGVVLRIDDRSTEGGVTPRSGSDTLRARLLEHELAGVEIEVWAPAHSIDVGGAIVAVGKDHLILRDHDDSEWALPLGDIAWVRGR
jgi:RNase P/RNase MRP subunit p29